MIFIIKLVLCHPLGLIFDYHLLTSIFEKKWDTDMYRHVIKQPHGHQEARVATICVYFYGMSSWPRF